MGIKHVGMGILKSLHERLTNCYRGKKSRGGGY